MIEVALLLVLTCGLLVFCAVLFAHGRREIDRVETMIFHLEADSRAAFADSAHKHLFLPHGHEELGMAHAHFWVRDGEPVIGARGFPTATYRCDVPGCSAKCIHELNV